MLELRLAAFDDPDVVALNTDLQATYDELYGFGDQTVMTAAEFVPPHGCYLLGVEDGRPVATGAWRAHGADPADPERRDGDAEIKRMYVVPGARGRGYARALLAELERTAAASGRSRAILETGTIQPEAIALYRSSGYQPIGSFGAHRDDPRAACFAKPLTG
ncbi:GNAT family N-acetyltransferase [Pseudonocardia phyllosphaerae]|uniref:GNAT family N-acetyltransferase n=1 Tax=Pseudonocardia phyllosphaerae TaxID=3390502 RepID=UPI00397A980A